MPPARSLPLRAAIKPNVLLDRLGLWMSRGRRIDGLWVGCWTSDSEKRLKAFGRVGEALGLIKQYDPLCYDRLRRDLDRIWVFLLPSSWGEYRHALKMCVLDERFVLSETTRSEQIASTIVHEATHARLMRCGIGYEPERRARVEAVCFRRQRAFAARLPAGEQARQEAERSATGYPSKFWTDEAIRERNEQGAAEAFRYLGSSELFIRNFSRLRAALLPIRRVVHRLKQLFRS